MTRIKLSKASLALIVAVIAAVTSLFTAVYGGWSKQSLERAKWERNLKDEATKQRNLALAQFAGNIARCGQRTAWFLSKSMNDAKGFSSKDIQAYDEAINPLLADLMKDTFIVAAHDREAFDTVYPIAKEYFKFDAQAARASAIFLDSPAKGIAEFQRIATAHENWLDTVPSRLATLISASASQDKQ